MVRQNHQLLPMMTSRRDETRRLLSMSEMRSHHNTPKLNILYNLSISSCDSSPWPLRHDHLEAVVVRIPGQRRVRHGQGVVQVEDFIVTPVTLATGQGQSKSLWPSLGYGCGRLSNLQSFRRASSGLVEVPVNLFLDLLLHTDLFKVSIQQCQSPHNSTPAGSSRRPCH